MDDPDRPSRIAIVGPCASGKSTLAQALHAAGYDARQPAQEHSYVPYMWQRITQPDILIYLDVDEKAFYTRRPNQHNTPQRLQEQHQRLSHARKHCDFYIDTSPLSPEQVQEKVLDFLQAE